MIEQDLVLTLNRATDIIRKLREDLDLCIGALEIYALDPDYSGVAVMVLDKINKE